MKFLDFSKKLLLMIFFIFYMIVEDIEVHHLSQIAIFRKFIKGIN